MYFLHEIGVQEGVLFLLMLLLRAVYGLIDRYVPWNKTNSYNVSVNVGLPPKKEMKRRKLIALREEHAH